MTLIHAFTPLLGNVSPNKCVPLKLSDQYFACISHVSETNMSERKQKQTDILWNVDRETIQTVTPLTGFISLSQKTWDGELFRRNSIRSGSKLEDCSWNIGTESADWTIRDVFCFLTSRRPAWLSLRSLDVVYIQISLVALYFAFRGEHSVEHREGERVGTTDRCDVPRIPMTLTKPSVWTRRALHQAQTSTS